MKPTDQDVQSQGQNQSKLLVKVNLTCTDSETLVLNQRAYFKINFHFAAATLARHGIVIALKSDVYTAQN